MIAASRVAGFQRLHCETEGRNGPMPATRRATDGICRRGAALFHPKKDSRVDAPRKKYAKAPDGVYIAYQTVGDGPIDIVWQFDWLGNVDTIWEAGRSARWFRGVPSFWRLILHYRRGTGAASRNVAPPNLETRVADLTVVLDA